MVIWNAGHRPPKSGRYLVTALVKFGNMKRRVVCCADYTEWRNGVATWHSDLSGATVKAWAELPEAWNDTDKD